MPFFWLTAPLSSPISAAAQAQKPTISDFGDEIQVTGNVHVIDTVRLIDTYEEGVVAKYGPTTITADRMEIHHAEGEKFGIARGNVHVDDPEGTIDADYVTFWYGPNKGPDGQQAVASNVRIQVENITMRAEYAVIRPERWELYNVEGTNCRRRPVPLFTIKSKKIVLIPGKQGTAYRPHITVLGKDVLGLPTRRFSLDRRSPGIQMPSLSYKKDAGLGIAWSSGLLLDDESVLLGSFSSFPRQLPGYSLVYARSFVPADLTTTKIAARDELDERFSWSYFDDIRITKPESSSGFAGRVRNSITAESSWNTGSTARLETEHFSKALDVAYEHSGPAKGFGFYWQVRGQAIRREGEDESFISRGLATATLQVPKFNFSPKLFTDIRFDVSGKGGGAGAFGWVRGQAGLIYRPIPQLTLGAAYVAGAQGGRPDFVSDELVSKNAMHLRADINLGPTQISYLAKYDVNGRGWYDKEYSISQVVGCLEPFITRREFPRDYVLGIRLRFGNLFDMLQRRKQTRTKPVPLQQISGPSEHP